MDVFKETFDAFSQRIRSPFAGSILLAFIVLNWKPVWFLLFANAKVVEKFDFFEQNTSAASLYLWPFILGVAVALVLPWSRFIGAWVARAPTRALKNLQTDEAQAQRIYQLVQSVAEENAKSDLEAAKEQAVIDSAQRLEEARGISEGAEEELRAQRDKARDEERFQQEMGLSGEPELNVKDVIQLPFAVQLLKAAANSTNGVIRLDGYNVEYYDISKGNAIISPGESHRDALAMQHTVDVLEIAGLFSNAKGGYEITQRGYEVLQELE